MGVLTGLDRVPAGEARPLARAPERLEILFGYREGELGFERGPHCGLDKSWKELVPLLSSTGFDHAARELDSYREIPDFDGGGWARYLNREDVREVSAALDAVDLAQVRAKRDVARGWDGPLGDSGLFEYAVSYLEETIAFFRAAAEAGDAIFLHSA